MAEFDLAVLGGRVVTPDGTIRADIAIAAGKIAAIGAVPVGAARRTIAAEDRLVLPGVVDSHVHVRDPGYTYKEDFASASAAAAAGGVTTMMCMPNTDPVLDRAQVFYDTAAAGETKSVVDFALQGLATARNLGELAALHDLGVVTFEVFLAGPDSLITQGRADQFKVFEALARLDATTGLYPDDGAAAQVLDGLGSGRIADIVAAHPPELEAGTLLPAATLAAAAGCRIHFRQMSSALSAACAAALKAKLPAGRFTCEVTPHHLTLNQTDFERAGPAGHIMPPLRSAADNDALWAALRAGTVDAIGTDHSPHAWAEKLKGDGDLRHAIPGFPGLETFLPVVLTEMRARGFDEGDFVRFACGNPAKLFGLYPRKGAIQVGSDADLAIVDEAAGYLIEPLGFHSKAHYSPFGGRTVQARVERTLVRGEVVFERGKVVAVAGHGQLLKPQRGRDRR